MAAPTHDKYFLKTLHQEIDLFDRKLAHMLKYDTSASEEDRQVAANKMAAKRELLARTARQLVSEGIEFKPSDLPRSFRGDEASEIPAAAADVMETASPAATDVAHPVQRAIANSRTSLSPFAGTVLDGQATVEAYKRTRTKSVVSQA